MKKSNTCFDSFIIIPRNIIIYSSSMNRLAYFLLSVLLSFTKIDERIILYNKPEEKERIYNNEILFNTNNFFFLTKIHNNNTTIGKLNIFTVY